MKTYTYVAKPGQYAFCKQEGIVFQALKNVGTGTLEDIATECVDLGLKTRQTPERIVAYYMVSLRKHGLVEISGQTTGARRVTIVISDDDVDETETEAQEETPSEEITHT
jgi:hypothetical protein